jgi:hypothetical protein
MTAHADWKYFGGHSYNTYDSYIDDSRIQTEGRYKSSWYLIDYKSPRTDTSGKQYKSDVLRWVVDCQGSKSQIVAFYNYSEQMGKGALVSSGNGPLQESNWSYHPPNSHGDSIIKVACGRK